MKYQPNRVMSNIDVKIGDNIEMVSNYERHYIGARAKVLEIHPENVNQSYDGIIIDKHGIYYKPMCLHRVRFISRDDGTQTLIKCEGLTNTEDLLL